MLVLQTKQFALCAVSVCFMHLVSAVCYSSHGICCAHQQSAFDHDHCCAQVCTSQLGYTPSASRLCNTFTCNSTADCSDNGVCNTTTSACQCQSGYTGPNCAISTGLCNTTATASNSTAAGSNSTEICCSTGIVNNNGTCCASGKAC